MLTRKRPRIVLSYTGWEWDQIEREIKLITGEKKREPVISFLISETKKLEASFLNHHPIDDSKKIIDARSYYPPAETLEILNRLSDKLNIKPSTLVARLLLNPLLKK
jgi:hypothetical protein